MSLLKKLSEQERESLYSAANSAIWYSYCRKFEPVRCNAREEDFVATLVTESVPRLVDRWTSILRPKGIQVRVSGVFCHGHPQVEFGPRRLRVELADLLVVHQHTTNKRSNARAILIQAKMSAGATHKLRKNDPQLQLFRSWPQFEFVTGGLALGMRDIKEKGKGSRYALILKSFAYPEEITWADQCPWGTCSATQTLAVERSLAKLLGDMLLGKDGRVFQLGSPKDDWSRMIQELLEVTGNRTYCRVNIGLGDTQRLVEWTSANLGMMLLVTSSLFTTFTAGEFGASDRAVSKRYFGAAPILGTDSDGQDVFRERHNELPDGGISTLIIETKEGE